MRKRLYTKYSFLALYLMLLYCHVTLAQNKSKDVFKLVIDAGHGGKDPGTRGARLKIKEKDIVLNVSLLLGRMIEKKMKRSVKVIYTRKSDVSLELWKRAEIAQKNNADLFLSIHCNYAPKNSRARGPETYVLGTHRNSENLEVAKRENSVIKLEANYQSKYKNWGATESKIALGAMQSSFLEQSLLLSKLLNESTKKAKRPSRRVKQAGFYVLRMVFMPSILIELGFLSNSKERNFLAKKKGQQIMAQCIFNAFKKYVSEIHQRNQYAKIAPIKSPNQSKPPATATQKTNSSAYKKSYAQKSKTTYPQKATKTNIYFSVQITVSRKKLGYDDKVFKILGKRRVSYYMENGYYKYIMGKAPEYQTALSTLRYVKKKGFADAFIVAFKRGKKISLSRAIRETKSR